MNAATRLRQVVLHRVVLREVHLRRVVQALFLIVLALFTPAARAADVDLLLVLAADVSRSIDAAKFQLQRDGYAAAVADARVLETIRAGRNGRIGLTFIEWSGIGAQRTLIDWMAVGDAASAKDFGDRLLESPRSFTDRTRSAAPSNLLWPSSPARHLARAAGPSIFPATAPIIPGAM